MNNSRNEGYRAYPNGINPKEEGTVDYDLWQLGFEEKESEEAGAYGFIFSDTSRSDDYVPNSALESAYWRGFDNEERRPSGNGGFMPLKLQEDG